MSAADEPSLRPTHSAVTPSSVIAAARQAPLSALTVFVCTLIFLGLISQADHTSWAALSQWGVLPPAAIYDGAYWTLVSSVFVHVAGWHLFFNMYWLWRLASRFEAVLGARRWLAFFILSAFVSSAFEFTFGGINGIGASGVVYAFAGFIWFSRERYPVFKQAINTQTTYLFLAWIVVGMVLTRLNVWRIGNFAPLAGFLFGALVALSVNTWQSEQMLRSSLLRACLGVLVGLAVLPLWWAPWSVAWLSTQAYRTHKNQEYDRALSYYNRIIQLDPANAWAFYNRSNIERGMGAIDQAQADRDRAVKLDPSFAQQKYQPAIQLAQHLLLLPRRLTL
jgi:GlpG protein